MSGPAKGEKHHAHRLTVDDVSRIRRGELGDDKAAAALLKVSKIAVFYARVGRNWQSCPVPPRLIKRTDLKSLEPRG